MKKLEFPFKLIDTEQKLIDYIDTIDYDKLLVHDTETTSILPEEAFIIGHALYQDGKEAVFILSDFPHVWEGIPPETIKSHLEPVLLKAKIGGHNYKYDWSVLRFSGYNPNINLVQDSIISAHLCNTDQKLKLETRVSEDLGYNKKTYEEVIGMKWDKIDWVKHSKAQIDKRGVAKPPVVTPFNLGYYGAEDVVATYELIMYYDKLAKDEGLHNLYKQVELPLTEVLVDMYYTGVCVDLPELRRQENLLREQLAEIKLDIYTEAGFEFNINSNPQKIDVLYNKMSLPVYGTTKTGAPATDKNALKQLSKDGHKIADLLLYYNKRSKILSTYLVAMQRLQKNGVIRANFNQNGTTTLRFSSSKPNLQNLSNDSDEEDFAVRRCFIPRPGNVFICTDYSAQEYAIAAHASGDENMRQVFIDKVDLHQVVADRAEVTRKQAKTVGFGIFYGLSIENLAELLKCTIDEASQMIEDYFAMFPRVRPWMEAVKDFVKRYKFIRTPVGSIRRFPLFNRDRNGAFRQAINACIQGSAAIQMKMAMVKVFRQLRNRPHLTAKIVLTVHDELILDCPPHEVEEVCNLVQHCMEKAITFFDVPFTAVPNVVRHYGDGKDDNKNLRGKLIELNELNYTFMSTVLNIGKVA